MRAAPRPRASRDRVARAAFLEGEAAGRTEHDAAASLPPEYRPPQFTKLDISLIRGVVSALNRTEGALEWDDLDELVQEVLELNESRERSHFHRGFLDGLRDRAYPGSLPGDNAGRRAWRIAGYLFGRIRRLGEREIPALIAGLEPRDHAALIDPHVVAGAMVAPVAIPPLLRAGRSGEARKWLQAHGRSAAPKVVDEVNAWAIDVLLHSGDAAAARAVLQQIVRFLDDLSAPAETRLPAAVVHRTRMLLADALRREGRLDEAGHVLEDLLASAGDDAERSEILCKRGLVRMGVRSLERLEVPDEKEPRLRFLDALRPALPEFEEATKVEPPYPLAPYALALPAIIDGAAGAEERRLATERLQRAITLMADSRQHVWEVAGILPRAQFYLAVLDLRPLDPAVAVSGVERLYSLLVAGAEFPTSLVLEAVGNAVLADVPRAAELACLALQRFGHRAFTSLDLETLSSRSLEFRMALAETLRDQASELKESERWNAWRSLLKGAGQSERRDRELLSECLDALEVLALEGGNAPDLTTLLRDTREWEPGWELDDRDRALYRLYLRAGENDQARSLLTDLAHRAISRGERHEFDDLVELLEQLEAEPSLLDPLRQRAAVELPALAATTWTTVGAEPASARAGEGGAAHPSSVEAAPPKVIRPCRVLFVGGNEKQDAYQQRLEADFARSHPALTLDFQTTGWDANWGRIADGLDGRLDQADAVVLMQFMRTHLGRWLRRTAGAKGKPWIACTGHGLASIRRAIQRAVEVAATTGAARRESPTQS